MHPPYKKSLFIFRRDLRLQDNTGLIYALEHSETVIPCFIFHPKQIEHNPYRSEHALQFMIESLADLEDQLRQKGGRLHLFYDFPEKIVEKCIKLLGVDAVMANRDYTPFSQSRDRAILKSCKSHGIEFFLFEDALLHPPEETLKADGTPYQIFTPYYRYVSRLEVQKPRVNHFSNYFDKSIPFSEPPTICRKILPNRAVNLAVQGGRKAGLQLIKQLGRLSRYASERDFPALQATTHLSAYLKFTILSPREIYYAILDHFNKDHELIRALHWRDFFTSITLFFPHVLKGAFHKKFDHIEWSQDRRAFKRWCLGETGFPIVDAGMRELNHTGLMHNRVRMIVASFLTKDLHLNWQWGERYFAQKLIDYDPAVNNGNWQWAASTGCDAQPYFRIFNPWNQQKRFDPEALYIKRWLPELKELPPKVIHQWYGEPWDRLCKEYPPPMVDHNNEVKKSLLSYQAAGLRR